MNVLSLILWKCNYYTEWNRIDFFMASDNNNNNKQQQQKKRN